MVLAAVAAALALLLFWLRGGVHPEQSLERLARRSPDLAVALANGRPTLVEFYADWCEACRAMAPAMETLERQHQGEVDVVLLNVDNPRWQGEVERFGVNGIPQIELFDAAGKDVGRSLGARSGAELEALTTALVRGEPLPELAGVGAISPLPASAAEAADSSGSETAPSSASPAVPAPMAGPRSHG